MSRKAQDAFARLSVSQSDPMWLGQPNAWIRDLAPARIGIVGEELALSVIGGVKAPNNRSGYDIKHEEKLIEVKLSSIIKMNGYPILVWRQIRPNDPYTHLCFIAVYPDDVRIFLVPKTEIPTDCMKHQHGREGSLEIFQIHTRKVHELFPWMVRNEIA
ncbi:MAG: hypothetical protein AB7N70_09555 [Dehalococcoidia bacterium]